eukprot:6490492-Amphidinium_carterae.1
MQFICLLIAHAAEALHSPKNAQSGPANNQSFQESKLNDAMSDIVCLRPKAVQTISARTNVRNTAMRDTRAFTTMTHPRPESLKPNYTRGLGYFSGRSRESQATRARLDKESRSVPKGTTQPSA